MRNIMESFAVFTIAFFFTTLNAEPICPGRNARVSSSSCEAPWTQTVDVLAAEMDTLQDDLTPVGRSFGGSIAVVASIPFGSIREYFSARFGGGYELQLFCRNVTFMP